MKIALVGNPNSGKSTLFNALTGGHAKTGNWHGVTVGASARRAEIGGKIAEVTDLPGLYSFESYSLEEKVAAKTLEEGSFDLVICVADALTLPRSLVLVKEAVKRFPRAVLLVTMRDLLEKRGGFINEKLLSERLGIPVLCISAHRKKDIRRAQNCLASVMNRPKTTVSQSNPSEILAGAYLSGAEAESVAEKILYNKFFALPLFLLAILTTFFLAFAKNMPGVLFKDLFEKWICEDLGGYLASKTAQTGAVAASEFLRSVMTGVGSVLSFVPQIAILYFALFLMEESGFMSALAFMTDGLFRKAGLTGRAVFSILMGFGCTAAAILTTRGLENKRLQKRVIMILCYISCSAKMPVYLAIASSFFEHSFLVLVCIYLTGVVLAFFAAFAAGKVYRGEEEFVMEIAHLQFPSLGLACKSLLFSIKQFIMKVATVIAAFLIVAWVMLSFSFRFEYVGTGEESSMLAVLCRGLKYLFYPMGITKWQVALAAVAGLVAKESVAGMLALFYGTDLTMAMSAPSALAFLLFIMTCSPCVSAIAATSRETGGKCAVIFAIGQTVIAFLASYALYFMLMYGAAAAVLLAACLLLASGVVLVIRRLRDAKIYREKTTKAERFHGRKLRTRFLCFFSSSSRSRRKGKRRKSVGKRDAVHGRRSYVLYFGAGGKKNFLSRSVSGRKCVGRR